MGNQTQHLTPELISKLKSIIILSALIEDAYLLKRKDHARFDPLAIAIKIFDIVIDNMGLYNGIEREPLIVKVIPMLTSLLNHIMHIYLNFIPFSSHSLKSSTKYLKNLTMARSPRMNSRNYWRQLLGIYNNTTSKSMLQSTPSSIKIYV